MPTINELQQAETRIRVNLKGVKVKLSAFANNPITNREKMAEAMAEKARLEADLLRTGLAVHWAQIDNLQAQLDALDVAEAQDVP
jgi:hypothetical protein